MYLVQLSILPEVVLDGEDGAQQVRQPSGVEENVPPHAPLLFGKVDQLPDPGEEICCLQAVR